MILVEFEVPMIPYSYNMVDMGGIDLVESSEPVPGLYLKIEEAANDCGDVVLYNWKFAGIEITPQYATILLGNPIVINGVINVYSNDTITITGIVPDPPVLIPLSVSENGQYSPLDYDAEGFSELSVEVLPVLEELTVTQNGIEYLPSEGHQGFSKVIVAIPETPPTVTVAVSGGYNGRAVVTMEQNGIQLFNAVADVPYNLVYTPNSGSAVVNGSPLSISIPTLPTNTSPLIINLSWGGTNKTVQFMHTGGNTSYGYGNQSTEVDFAQ